MARKPRDIDTELAALMQRAKKLKSQKTTQFGELVQVTGADALQEILSWRSSEQLFELAEFVGCTRPGYAMDPGTLDGMPHDRVTIVEIPALAISSTDCRRRAARGEPVWYLVPDGVVQYIAKHRLYPTDHPSESSS